ncbi:MAG: WbuC family cupin fold metalloprotein [Leptospiraceae bacterium]|nr:WbuC family cupin fold metalloprotein [Leptospiraceae bacterium]MCP5513742.1 WbuC family cupin fold metalloprotein [Leptospiraceae bacterium]
MEKVSLISRDLIDGVIQKADESPRKRMNHNFHQLEETYQRFLNVLCKGTYVRPHRHLDPPKAETFLVLEGELVFIEFDDFGNILNKYRLKSGGPNFGIDIQPGVWHSLVCVSEKAVCFEGKHGPYNPANDKDFASWAPDEKSPEKEEVLRRWSEAISDPET